MWEGWWRGGEGEGWLKGGEVVEMGEGDGWWKDSNAERKPRAFGNTNC